MMDTSRLLRNLTEHGFTAKTFADKESAADYLCREISGRTVGIGGSKTIDDMGLYDRLQVNNDVAWHWKQEPNEARKRAEQAEIYICSANAVSESGEIVNIDATGNRLAGTLYGKKKVYIVIGTNKIEPTLEKAVWRARNVAAPLNAKRFGLATPCAQSEELRCFDCRSPQRLCKGLLIFMRKMNGVDECEVIIINDSLGY